MMRMRSRTFSRKRSLTYGKDMPHSREDATSRPGSTGLLSTHASRQTVRRSAEEKELKVVCEGGVRYSVPVRICPDHLADDALVTLRFRVANVYKNKKIVVYAGDDVIFSKKRPVLAPGEMETVILKAKVLKEHSDLDHITVTLEEA